VCHGVAADGGRCPGRRPRIGAECLTAGSALDLDSVRDLAPEFKLTDGSTVWAKVFAVVLIFASFALFALEAKFSTHGVMAIGGIVTLVLGGLLLIDAPIPEMRVKLWTALAVSIPLGLITVFLMTIALQARRNKVVTGIEGLIGEIGTAQTALAPSGKVFIHGEIWNATASSEVGVGQNVVVEKVDGLQLQVTPTSRAPEKTTA